MVSGHKYKVPEQENYERNLHKYKHDSLKSMAVTTTFL